MIGTSDQEILQSLFEVNELSMELWIIEVSLTGHHSFYVVFLCTHGEGLHTLKHTNTHILTQSTLAHKCSALIWVGKVGQLGAFRTGSKTVHVIPGRNHK